MQFQPGQSGNPAGKKPGTLSKRMKIAKLFEPHAPALIAKCIEMALAGNEAAMRLAIERIVPKAKDHPAFIEVVESAEGRITGKEIATMGENILRQLASEEITPLQARSMFGILNSYRDNLALEEVVRMYETLSAEFKKLKQAKTEWPHSTA